MLITNIEDLFDEEKSKQKMSYQTLAYRMGMSRQSVYDAVHGKAQMMPSSTVKAFEALGYDLKIELVKRE